MSEGAPVKRDKACFPACLQVINTLRHEVRKKKKKKTGQEREGV